jgi:hypothetical protein
MAGFDMIGGLAEELAANRQSLFQPAPKMAGLFAILMAGIMGGPHGEARAVLAQVAWVHRPLMWLAGGGALTLLCAALAGSFWLVVLGLVLGALIVVGLIGLIGLALWRSVSVDLPAHDFGICLGATMPGAAGPGLTEWIADRSDRAAGNLGPDGTLGAPLTVGQLSSLGIEIAAMTTDLSSQRPYQLPLRSKHHFFSRSEFERLFPARIVAYLVGHSAPEAVPGGPKDLHPLPVGDAVPVALCARMSLSFPGLIAAVPLWRRDFEIKGADGRKGVFRRCLFLDGGISSNFPIHFFDALLPTRPTFGISLTAWDEARHGNERVHLSDAPVQSTGLPVRAVPGVGVFLGAILNTAKDWQGTLQSKLPGYAERIVEVRLDKAREGGVNLAMSPQTSATLADYGRRAGAKLVDDFDFDENRWRRALSLMPNLKAALEGVALAHDAAPAGGGPTYAEILTD